MNSYILYYKSKIGEKDDNALSGSVYDHNQL